MTGEDLESDDDIDVLLGHADPQLVDDPFNGCPDDEEADESHNVDLEPSDILSSGLLIKAMASDRSEAEHRNAVIERSAIPLWLTNDYKAITQRLAGEIKKSSKKMPCCYENGTFIDCPPLPYFKAQSQIQLQPRDFYRPKYFIWLPHLLVKCIPCPACISAG